VVRGHEMIATKRIGQRKAPTCQLDISKWLTLDSVQHQEYGQDTAYEDADPHPGVLQDVTVAESGSVGVLSRTSRKLKGCRCSTGDDIQPAGR